MGLGELVQPAATGFPIYPALALHDVGTWRVLEDGEREKKPRLLVINK
jgi:hypothetical protein